MMKHLARILSISTLLLLCCFTSFGQTYTEEESSFEEETVKRETITPNLLNTFGFNNEPNPQNRLVEGNSIFLRQVGDFNQVNVQAIANASEINVTQNGNENLTDLRYDVNTAVTNLQQNGDGNRIIDFVFDKSANISLDLEQNGDNITFERFGSNKLTESLKFKQTEASPVIIVRSFN